MASSGSFSGSIRNDGYTLRVDWSSSQSTANNTSTITCEMYLVQKKDYGLSISSRSNTTTIDGTSISYTSAAINNGGNATVHLGTVTRTVSHNADGTKGLYLSSVFNINATLGGTKYNTIEASSDWITLPTIPRASSVSCAASASVGGTIAISISRAADTFTHNLTYSVGGASGTIASGVGTSYTWSIPTTLTNYITGSASAVCTITCATYSGGTWIGSKSTSFTLTVPNTAAYQPSISAVNTTDPTGYKTTYGSYIRGMSRIRVQTTASGAYGSAITSYNVSVNNETGGSANYISGLVSSSCPSSVAVTVRDSRGRTASKTVSGLTFLDYAAPSVSGLTVKRASDTSGATEDDEGNYAKISFAYTFSSLGGKNSKSISLASKANTASYYTVLETVTPSGYTGTYTKVVAASADNAYTYRITMTDDLSSPITYIDLPTAETVFDILADGTGIAFGKVASKPNTLESAWDADVAGLSMDTIKSDMVPDSDASHDIGSNSTRYANIHALQAYLNGLQMLGNIVPNSTGTRNLGSSSLRWNYVYGNTGNFNNVYANGRNLCTNKVLWSGSYYMNSSQTATLSEAVSAQPHGIVLAFNAYYGSVTENAYNFFFIPKYFVTTSRGYSFFINEDVAWMAAKYLYVSDTKITGHSVNATNSTSCGITFTNTNAVLRYVIGV